MAAQAGLDIPLPEPPPEPEPTGGPQWVIVFQGNTGDLDDPGWDAFAVTPSNSTNFAYTARALYIGSVGDVTVVTATATSSNSWRCRPAPSCRSAVPG